MISGVSATSSDWAQPAERGDSPLRSCAPDAGSCCHRNRVGAKEEQETETRVQRGGGQPAEERSATRLGGGTVTAPRSPAAASNLRGWHCRNKGKLQGQRLPPARESKSQNYLCSYLC